MKKSYKLYGSFWDGRSMPDETVFAQCIETATDCQTSIKLSQVMKSEQPTVPLTSGGVTNLIVDYVPTTQSIIIWDFFLKRMLQIAEYYHASVTCTDEDYAARINDHLVRFYKRQAPNDCWRNQSVLVR